MHSANCIYKFLAQVLLCFVQFVMMFILHSFRFFHLGLFCYVCFLSFMLLFNCIISNSICSVTLFETYDINYGNLHGSGDLVLNILFIYTYTVSKKVPHILLFNNLVKSQLIVVIFCSWNSEKI